MSSALKPGRPVRYRPSKIRGRKPPECAGIYYIYDADGNKVYTGQAINLRRRVYQHKKNGKIPDGGYVDCIIAKSGITYDELDDTERSKISKYNPPLNRRRGGGGRKSPSLARHRVMDVPAVDPLHTQEISQKRNSLYRLFGYEKIDKSGEIHYLKEPKPIILIIVDLIAKSLLIVSGILAAIGFYLKFSKEILINQYLLIYIIFAQVAFYVLFPNIRRSRMFRVIVLISLVAYILLYLISYPPVLKLPS